MLARVKENFCSISRRGGMVLVFFLFLFFFFFYDFGVGYYLLFVVCLIWLGLVCGGKKRDSKVGMLCEVGQVSSVNFV